MSSFQLLADISIHALREEGDTRRRCGLWRTGKFLSTPSARRATAPFLVLRLLSLISIHALREEGDPNWCKMIWAGMKISIHALREEGDES